MTEETLETLRNSIMVTIDNIIDIEKRLAEQDNRLNIISDALVNVNKNLRQRLEKLEEENKAMKEMIIALTTKYAIDSYEHSPDQPPQPREDKNLPCPHLRPSWKMCPHCIGINNSVQLPNQKRTSYCKYVDGYCLKLKELNEELEKQPPKQREK